MDVHEGECRGTKLVFGMTAAEEAQMEFQRIPLQFIAALGEPVTLQLFAVDLEVQRERWDAALERIDRIAARSARQETWLLRRGEILEQAGRSEAAS